MQNQKHAFTFVELIIVLVIITILATVGFTAYESYLSVGRDTAKISLLRDIQNTFTSYSLKSRIPLPSDSVTIVSSGSTFAYQGDFTGETANSISFSGDPYDDTLSIYPSYILSDNRKDFQLLHYLEDPESTQVSFVPDTHANDSYRLLFPKILGKGIGIMIDDDSLEPLHHIDSVQGVGIYDIINGTGSLRAYYDSKLYYSDDLVNIIPNNNCKRILELGRSTGDGEYNISIDGLTNQRVYCNMSVDGGGWTYIAYSDTHNTVENLFSSTVGDYQSNKEDSDSADNNSSYSIDVRGLKHTEMMISLNDIDVLTANKKGKLFFFKYGEENDYFNNGPLPCTQDEVPFYRIGLTGSYERSSAATCTNVRWSFGTAASSAEVIFQFESGEGNHFPIAAGGSYGDENNSSRIYVR